MSKQVKAIGAISAGVLGPVTITRRACTESDVAIDIKYAGICHSDIHTVKEEWGPITLPQVVGHEIAGIVTEVGSKVTKFKVGDIVGVGCMVDSCRSCTNCKAGLEQYCATGAIFTYNSKHKYAHCPEYNSEGGTITQGGYSTGIVVQEPFVVKVPSNLSLPGVAPLLCAGITTYSPLKYYGLKPEHKFAVVGLGGLGHMGIKFGKAWGCHTTAISRGVAKKESSLALGADAYLDSTDKAAMAAAVASFDFILDTVSADHDMNAILSLGRFQGTLVMVGAGPDPIAIRFGSLIFKRMTVGGSLIGGIQETQEMLDFCGKHNIVSEVEVINGNQVNEAYTRAIKGDVKYRFVIDISTL